MLCVIIPARAIISGSKQYQQIKGVVSFYQTSYGVIVRAEVIGLPRGNGECNKPIFAFHIHSGTNCDSTSVKSFVNAGTHYNPKDCLHPYHSGDMPPLFSVNGRTLSVFLTDRFTVREVVGKVVIIHNLPDDFTTQPAGNAGEKIACGAIERLYISQI